MKMWFLVLVMAALGYAETSAATESASAPLVADSPTEEPSLAFADGESIRNLPPRYPGESRNAREEGTVQLRVVVGVEGSAKEVSVAQSSGYARLDASALEAVRKWRFMPAKQGDKLIEGSIVIPVSFWLTK